MPVQEQSSIDFGTEEQLAERQLTREVVLDVLKMFQNAGLAAEYSPSFANLIFRGGRKITQHPEELGVEIEEPNFSIFLNKGNWIASIDNLDQQLPPEGATFKQEIAYDDRDYKTRVTDSPQEAAWFIVTNYLYWLTLGKFDQTT